MNPFYAQFDSPAALQDLEPEEVAFLILRSIRDGEGNQRRLHIQNFTYVGEQIEFAGCKEIIAEGWCWLENQGLLIPCEGMNGQSGFRFLSRWSKKIADEAAFREFQYYQTLCREIRHQQISERVRGDFVRGNFDAARDRIAKDAVK